MASILDVAPVNRKVSTAKYGELEVTGLSIDGIVTLIKAHPEIMDMVQKGEDLVLSMTDILSMGVDIVAEFLAAGLGHPGNTEAIKKCRALNAEDAWTIGNAILDESFPGGAANFIQKIVKAANQATKLLEVSAAPSPNKKAAA